MEFKYSYQIGLSIVRQDKDYDFTTDTISTTNGELSVEELIRKKIDEFSQMSRNSARNSKMVPEDSVVITPKNIVFTLCSENELPAVGKSIRMLSRLLISGETQPYFDRLKLDKKLFRTYVPAEMVDEETGEIEVIDPSSSLSDIDFAKKLISGLIDYLQEPQFPYSKEKNDKKNAIQEMKAIAVKSGLVRL